MLSIARPRAVPVAVDLGEIDAGEAADDVAGPELIVDDLERTACRGELPTPHLGERHRRAGADEHALVDRRGEHRQHTIGLVRVGRARCG